jgi:hypothetical protein
MYHLICWTDIAYQVVLDRASHDNSRLNDFVVGLEINSCQ